MSLQDWGAIGELHREEAKETLAAMVERYESQGYRIAVQHLPDADYPQYAVYDHGDSWIGTYTIILQ